jgi:hypothetical protein
MRVGVVSKICTPEFQHITDLLDTIDALESDRDAWLREKLGPIEELIREIQPTISFYLKREIESPSLHQEFAREAQEKLDKFYKLLAALERIKAK